MPIAWSVDVAYHYPVIFTTNVFAADTLTSRDLCGRTTTGGPSRALVIVDRGISEAFPSPTGEIDAYCGRHSDTLQLVQEPMLVEGDDGIHGSHGVPRTDREHGPGLRHQLNRSTNRVDG
jgi:hypothetical protein